jgi:hypothetical protein
MLRRLKEVAAPGGVVDALDVRRLLQTQAQILVGRRQEGNDLVLQTQARGREETMAPCAGSRDGSLLQFPILAT